MKAQICLIVLGSMNMINLETIRAEVHTTPLSPMNQQSSLAMELMADQSLVTLQGKVIKKPWSKNVESWMAGGSDYYVLDVGQAKIQARSAVEGVILRPSRQITIDQFADYIGKKVEVQGHYISAQPYVPKFAWESYPVDMNGKPLPRGAGFQVLSIKILSGT